MSNTTGSFVRSLRLSPKTDPDLTTFVVDIEERGIHVPQLIRLLLREYMERTEPRYLEPAFWKQKRHEQVVRYHKRMLQRVEGALDAVDEVAPAPAVPQPKVKPVTQTVATPPVRAAKAEPVLGQEPVATPMPVAQSTKSEAPPPVKTEPPAKLQETTPEVIPAAAPPSVGSAGASSTPAPSPSTTGTTGYGGKFLDES